MKHGNQGEHSTTVDVKKVENRARRVILVDMDNTLCDWESRFEEMMAKHYPLIQLLQRQQRVSWNQVDDYPREHYDAVTKVCGIPGFFEDMKPNQGSLEALQAMVDDGNQVFLVSSPEPDFCAQSSAEKCQWVLKYLGSEWTSKLILTQDTTIIHGDVLIDDKPLIHGVIDTPSWEHILFWQSYTPKNLEGRKCLHRWCDWRTVLD